MNLYQTMAAGSFLVLVCGRLPAIEPVTPRSLSGQFFIKGLPLSRPLLAPGTNAESKLVRLDPTLLAVSCERIKSAVLSELAMKDLWRGKVYISLHPVRDDDEPIFVTSVHYPDGWSYHVEIPEQVEASRLIRSLVQVVLLEIANRNAHSFAAELPLWLTEGLTAHLQATILASFTLEPDTRVLRRGKVQDPLARPRQRLQTQTGLTFNELSWPEEKHLSESEIETYQSCAQLFVCELLRLRDGRACLRETLARLPEHLNWQTAFLQAFHSHFQRLIDVDKWWSLHLVHLTGQGFASVWVREEICRQLEDTLTTPIEVRLSSRELPLTSHVKLQTMLAEWDFRRQQPILVHKRNLLQALALRTTQDAAVLVLNYQQTIEDYLQHRSKLGGWDRKTETSSKVRLLVKETCKRLDQLDNMRESLRKQKEAPSPQLTVTH